MDPAMMNLDMADDNLLKFKVKKVRPKNRKQNHLLNGTLDPDEAKRKTKVSKEDKRNIFYITKALE